MVEYTLDTLVHLFDSLNTQIESAKSDLNRYVYDNSDLTFNAEVIPEIKGTRAKDKAEKRLEKLISIRDNVEVLLSNILRTEVAEFNDF